MMYSDANRRLITVGSLVTIALKVEKKEGEAVDYTKLKVKELKTILGTSFSPLVVELPLRLTN